MNKLIILALASICSFSTYAQITTELSSLPDVGDELSYKLLDNISDTYLTDGEGVLWDFSDMLGNEISLETYAAAEDGAAFEDFPDSDMLVTFNGVEAYANRNTTNIEIIGVSLGDFFEGVELPLGQTLDQSYIIRRAPIGYGDTFSGSTSFDLLIGGATLDPLSELLAGVVGEGATVDSLRVSFNFSRTEEVDSYGTAVFENGTAEVLRLVQNDVVDYTIEMFVVTGFIDTWIDVSELVDTGDLGVQNQTLTNYVFLDATSKEFILEVNENDTDGTTTGRYKSTFVNSVNELKPSVVSVFPNPTTDLLTVSAPNISAVYVVNALGQAIEVEQTIFQSRAELSLENLPSGMYTLVSEFRNGSSVATRILKQ